MDTRDWILRRLTNVVCLLLLIASLTIAAEAMRGNGVNEKVFDAVFKIVSTVVGIIAAGVGYKVGYKLGRASAGKES